MTATTIRARRRSAIRKSALVATLTLAGCGSEHVGDSWQCPLAEGGSCTSVAAADPAVPVGGSGTVLGEPLWKPRVGASEPLPGTVCTAGCGETSGPFGWLGRLLGGGGDLDAGPETDDGAPGIVVSTLVPAKGNDGLAELTSSALPAGHVPWRGDADWSDSYDGIDPAVEDLRTDEVVARIWIAPFVDGNGVYREAGHVRVVLEPAGWRDG